MKTKSRKSRKKYEHGKWAPEIGAFIEGRVENCCPWILSPEGQQHRFYFSGEYLLFSTLQNRAKTANYSGRN